MIIFAKGFSWSLNPFNLVRLSSCEKFMSLHNSLIAVRPGILSRSQLSRRDLAKISSFLPYKNLAVMGEATAISASVVLRLKNLGHLAEMVEATDEFLSSAWKISLRSWSPCILPREERQPQSRRDLRSRRHSKNAVVNYWKMGWNSCKHHRALEIIGCSYV